MPKQNTCTRRITRRQSAPVAGFDAAQQPPPPPPPTPTPTLPSLPPPPPPPPAPAQIQIQTVSRSEQQPPDQEVQQQSDQLQQNMPAPLQQHLPASSQQQHLPGPVEGATKKKKIGFYRNMKNKVSKAVAQQMAAYQNQNLQRREAQPPQAMLQTIPLPQLYSAPPMFPAQQYSAPAPPIFMPSVAYCAPQPQMSLRPPYSPYGYGYPQHSSSINCGRPQYPYGGYGYF